MKYVLDTHALIWFLEGSSRLGAGAKAVLMDPASELILPAIALAEALWIVEKGRTSIPSVQDLLNAVQSDARVTIYPLGSDILEQSLSLTVIHEMHDRQIVSTVQVLASQGYEVALLTCDTNITVSKSVSIIW